MATQRGDPALFTLDLDKSPVNEQPSVDSSEFLVTNEADSHYSDVDLDQHARDASQKENWPFVACCSLCVSCKEDTPVCCYALLCPLCLHTEMKMKLAADERHCW